MPNPPTVSTARIDDVLAQLEAGFEARVEELCTLARIPSVSAAGFPKEEVARSADAVAALLRASGFASAEILELDGAHPYVVGEWLGAGPQAPTLLLYAHHDVQPPGRATHWRSSAFEPTRRAEEGEAGRLYGRGVVDDKAGVVVFAAALRAWLEAGSGPPVNLKIVVEGEEEIGSEHLAEFLRAHHERLAADVLVLSDTANFATGLPSVTTSLRGLVIVDVRVRALDHPIHSGMWGGPIPDAATALTRILARLFDAAGDVAIPDFEADVPALSSATRARLERLPIDDAAFRADVGLVDSAELIGGGGTSLYERIWYRPALSLTAIEGMTLAEAANNLLPEAAARVGIRLAPGQDPARMRERVVALLGSDPPWGVEVSLEVGAEAGGWSIEPAGAAFAAAERALARGYGREPVFIGCGGSIPFVGPFAEVLGGAPALLLGLEDPICNAHGENESLDLADFRRAMRSAAILFGELARFTG
jgi:acetylornithine deacetylase/succinyl-diaminopimelate desuccinylase-like protein